MSYKLKYSAEAINRKLGLINETKNYLPYPYDSKTTFPTSLEDVGDGSILTRGGTIPEGERELLLNTCAVDGGKKYIISLEVTNILETAADSEGFTLKIVEDGTSTNIGTLGSLDYSARTDKTSIAVWLVAPATTFSANLLIKPQIEEGDTKTIWEPFMGTVSSYTDKRFSGTNAKIKVLSESLDSGLDSGLDKVDLVVQNSISMGRKEDTTIGEKSTAIGADVKAINYATSAEGYATTAGSFGFRITAIESGYYVVEDPDAQLTEFSVGGQNVDFSVITKDNYDLAGKMLQCYINEPENGLTKIYVDSVIAGELVSNPTGSNNTIRFPDYPELGYIQTGSYSHTEGYETRALGLISHAEGYATQALGKYAHAEGYSTKAVYAAHAEGRSNSALGQCSHAEGKETLATKEGAHSEGITTQALGVASHAEGTSTIATEFGTHAEGAGTQANGESSHAEGKQTIADGEGSHAEGMYSHALGEGSHAEGTYIMVSGEKKYSRAKDKGAHAEGLGTYANGLGTHAEGVLTQAIASQAHAEGNGTTASGQYSHAEGLKTTASGTGSHAEGASTTASGGQSHAEGNSTTAAHSCSFTGGLGTQSSANNQMTIGTYNKANANALFVVGNGTSADARSNAFEVISSTAGVSIKIGNTVLTEDMLKALLSGGNLANAEEVLF